jgi:copper chaperone CopZ
MKTIKILIISIVGFFVVPTHTITANSHFSQKEPTTLTDSFEVTNMDCHNDANIVERRLYRLKGVKKVKIEGDIVIVTYSSKKTNAKAIKETIEDSGTCTDPNDKTHKATKK